MGGVVLRQYTTPEQTAKLIELGFEKPKMAAPALKWVDGEPTFEPQYTIGELIEMLPEFSCIYDLTNMHTMKRCWYVGQVSSLNVSADELIDALYDMIVKLKEEGVI